MLDVEDPGLGRAEGGVAVYGCGHGGLDRGLSGEQSPEGGRLWGREGRAEKQKGGGSHLCILPHLAELWEENVLLAY